LRRLLFEGTVDNIGEDEKKKKKDEADSRFRPRDRDQEDIQEGLSMKKAFLKKKTLKKTLLRKTAVNNLRRKKERYGANRRKRVFLQRQLEKGPIAPCED